MGSAELVLEEPLVLSLESELPPAVGVGRGETGGRRVRSEKVGGGGLDLRMDAGLLAGGAVGVVAPFRREGLVVSLSSHFLYDCKHADEMMKH